MVTIENLFFNYGKREVLSNISLKLEKGKIYGLLGENGVGKTTLLKIISGLQPPLSGSCLVFNENPFDRTPSFLRDLFYLPEELDFIRVEHSLHSFGEQNGPFYPNFSMTKYLEILNRFSLSPSQKFNKLSYGQAKKGAIAFALATNVSLLLLDEPSNGLDIPSKSLFRSVLSDYCLEESTTVISTHQVRDLENLIDPIIIMDNRATILNESLERIAEKLYFSLESSVAEEALYYEVALGGYLTVTLNSEGNESRVNLEAFFNATINNRELIENLFKE